MIFFIRAIGSSWCLSREADWLISVMTVIQNSFIFAFFSVEAKPTSIFASHDISNPYGWIRIGLSDRGHSGLR